MQDKELSHTWSSIGQVLSCLGNENTQSFLNFKLRHLISSPQLLLTLFYKNGEEENIYTSISRNDCQNTWSIQVKQIRNRDKHTGHGREIFQKCFEMAFHLQSVSDLQSQKPWCASTASGATSSCPSLSAAPQAPFNCDLPTPDWRYVEWVSLFTDCLIPTKLDAKEKVYRSQQGPYDEVAMMVTSPYK